MWASQLLIINSVGIFTCSVMADEGGPNVLVKEMSICVQDPETKTTISESKIDLTGEV